nr:uncharacterized protein LOC121126725 [Lepeophtheirus salmonis]
MRGSNHFIMTYVICCLVYLSIFVLLVCSTPTFFDDKKGNKNGVKCILFYDKQYEVREKVIYITKCATMYKKICQPVSTIQLQNAYVNECKTNYIESCHTSYSVVKEMSCKNYQKEYCDQISSTQHQQNCVIAYEKKCNSYDGKCILKPKHKCSTIPVPIIVKNCNNFPKKYCHTPNKSIPKTICRHIPTQNCGKILKNIPRKVEKKICSKVPSTNCSKVPRTKTFTVPVIVPRKVCEKVGEKKSKKY